VAGIKVVALRGDQFRQEPVAVSVTDANGQYRLHGLAAGTCRVGLDAASFAWKGEEPDDETSSKSVTLAEGETVEGINIEVVPGGVITGRVTDSTGRPIIDETVRIIPFKEVQNDREDDREEDRNIGLLADRFKASTDDRGIYRAYGLPAGPYRVSVGDRITGKVIKPSFGRVPSPLTYYSAGPDKTWPAVVEVAAGTEITNVDISVARPSLSKSNTYMVSGRLIDDTGKPLPNAFLFYHPDRSSLPDRSTLPDAESLSDLMHQSSKTDAKGQFTFRDVAPGRYSVSLRANAESPWYSDDAGFEISNSDVEALEITAKAAGGISGIVVLEGASDPSVAAGFSQLRIDVGFSFERGVPIGKDGTFKITGINPSLLPASGPAQTRVSLGVDTNSQAEGFEITRVERDGIEQQDETIEVGAGENVSGVKVVVACYKGSVRGQITIEGGALPAGGHLEVSATPLGQPKQNTSFATSKSLALVMSGGRSGDIDSRGRFTIDHLPPGEYEITLDAYLAPVARVGDDQVPITISKEVTVTGGDPIEISLVIDLSKKQ
jgi:protocatechuate 3,4-dioxygenase beta subunit